MKPFDLRDFVVESNRIEGIPTVQALEMDAHKVFLAQPVSVDSLEFFVDLVAGASLRDKPGMDVRVGDYRPMCGGPQVGRALKWLLGLGDSMTPFEAHVEYESIHPFMDGNGRSGRALWLHMMGGIENAPLGFLHHWYYQSLQMSRDTPSPGG